MGCKSMEWVAVSGLQHESLVYYQIAFCCPINVCNIWISQFITFLRFCWGDLRMLGKLWSTLALRLVCHTATQSLMCAPREGSLRRQEEGGTAGASRSKWPQPCESMPFCSYQLNITVLVCLDVRISCYYLISDQSNFAPIICAVGLVVSPSRRYSHIFMGGNCVKVYLAFLHCSSMFAWQLYSRNLFI